MDFPKPSDLPSYYQEAEPVASKDHLAPTLADVEATYGVHNVKHVAGSEYEVDLRCIPNGGMAWHELTNGVRKAEIQESNERNGRLRDVQVVMRNGERRYMKEDQVDAAAARGKVVGTVRHRRGRLRAWIDAFGHFHKVEDSENAGRR